MSPTVSPTATLLHRAEREKRGGSAEGQNPSPSPSVSRRRRSTPPGSPPGPFDADPSSPPHRRSAPPGLGLGVRRSTAASRQSRVLGAAGSRIAEVRVSAPGSMFSRLCVLCRDDGGVMGDLGFRPRLVRAVRRYSVGCSAISHRSLLPVPILVWR